MFGDIGWAELLIIGVVALIVIGPEDLPEMFRQLGRFTGKIRQMAREFQRAMDQAAKESGVNDVAKDLKSATSAKSLGLTAVKDAADKFEKWDPLKQARPAPKPANPINAAPPAAPTAAADPAPAAPAEGPATSALRAKKEARAAVIREMGDKLKAVEAGDLSVAAPAPKAKRSAPAPEAGSVTKADAPAKAAPRKKKAPEA
jgi:sec-independent protein translocase protein TatB